MELWVLVCIGLAIYWLYYQLIGRGKEYPPGPIPLPFIGNLNKINPLRVRESVDIEARKYGGVVTLWLGNLPSVFITEYKEIKDLLLGKNADAIAGRPDMFILRAFYGRRNSGLVFSWGDLWREQRRFSLHTLRDFGFGRTMMEDSVRERADELISHIKDLSRDNPKGLVGLHEPINAAIVNVISQVIVGRMYPRGSQKVAEIRAALDRNQTELGGPMNFLLGSYPWLRHIPILNNMGYNTLVDVGKIFFDLIREEAKTIEKTFDPNNEPSCYGEAFMKEMHKRKETGQPLDSFDYEQMIRVMGDIWGAGFETTVTTIRWIFLYLVRFPDVQAKMHAEIDAYYADSSKLVEMSDKQNLPYTTAALQEGQRMANIFALNVQHETVEDIYVKGHLIKKGTTVFPQISSVLHDPEIFPEPEKFKPERFLEDGKLRKVEQFIPFSLGKRSCAGESLARMEIFMMTVSVLRKLKFAVPAGHEPPSLEQIPGFTPRPCIHQVTVTAK